MSRREKLATPPSSWPPASAPELPARPSTWTAATTSWAFDRRHVAHPDICHVCGLRSCDRGRRAVVRLRPLAGDEIPNPCGGAVRPKRIVAGGDDGEEYAAGATLIRSPDLDVPFILAGVLNRNLHVPILLEAGKLFSPLDQENAVCVHQIVQSQGVQFALRVNAIKIDVVERNLRAAVFVNQSKRRAGDAVSFRSLEAFSNAFDQRGLPCSQIAAQQDDASRLQLRSQPAAEFRSFFGGMGLEGPHRCR